MEDCQGKELFHYITNKLSANTFMELSTIRQVTRQLLEAVRYLHDEMHMMHRDIKPENIIFDPLTKRIKLVDFGYACRDLFRDSNVGSPYYMAYEIVRNNEYTHSVDEWSTGIVLYIMMYGTPLFHDRYDYNIFKKIRKWNGDVSFPEHTAPPRSTDNVTDCNVVKECIRSLLNRQPLERATAAQILKHPWFAQSC